MSISFSTDGERHFLQIVERYDEGRSAVIPVMSLAQEEFGCLSPEVQSYLADRLGIPVARIHELVTFYSMFHEGFRGKHLIMVCKSLTCRLIGSNDLLSRLRERIGPFNGHTSVDGKVTIEEVECIGACDRSPACIVDGVLYGPVDEREIEEILGDIR